MNLYEETIYDLEMLKISFDDIDQVLIRHGKVFDIKTEEDLKILFDIDYYESFGMQEINDILCITLKDGSWLERREYDGSEWWSHQTRLEGGDGNHNRVLAKDYSWRD